MNPYDANAVRVEWRGVKLGYVPRRDNAAVARQMDRGAALEARLAGLRETATAACGSSSRWSPRSP